MSDSDAVDNGTDVDVGPVSIGARVESALARIMDGVGARDVFGDPQTVGDRMLITASVIERAGGFGFGGGFGTEADDEQQEGGSVGGGGGGGGGGSVVGRPVAVIEVGPSGVNVRPVVDVTRIGITVATSVLAALGVARGARRLGRG
jgi:uncharacterized spore protein YtfJ